LPTGVGPLLLTALTAPNQINNRFVRQRLPWIIGGAGLLVYLVTVNHWISLASLGTVARTAGLLWQPEPGRPLTLAVLSPFRLLPDSWLPLALNLFTAALAGLALAQLARSVVLLRYNVSSEDPFHQGKPISAQLTGPYVWMPPTLAALVCGLQLTFWENATSATGEMISLLCFAYALRCLLEFRVTGTQSWLSRGICVYAAGMTDNWMMVGYAPVLVAILVWTKGFGPFLQPRFLFRIIAWGLIGLSLYLLIPTLLSLSANEPTDFKSTLVTHLKSQKQMLALFRAPALRMFVLLALLPAIFQAVRWRSHTVQFADDTQLGIGLIKVAGHSAHALFFAASLWIALNPAFLPLHKDLGLPLLVFYYVWALMTGYCAGYFLLFKSGQPQRPSKYPVYGLAFAIGLLLLLLPWRNFSEIRATNGPAVRNLARQLYQELPAGKSVVFSEDPRQLLLLRAELAAHGSDKNPVLVDTPALAWPQYHRAMAAQHGTRWPNVLTTKDVEKIRPVEMLSLASQLAAPGPLYYLHPSSGIFLEEFSDAPAGLIQRLSPRGDEILDAKLAADCIATNDQTWQQQWTEHLHDLAEQLVKLRQSAARWSQSPFKDLRLAKRQNATAGFLGAVYSKAFNHWGVEVRRSGNDPEAEEWFQRSIEMNPDNLAARINLEYARRCVQGDRSRLKMTLVREEFSEALGKYENWWEVISQNGPVDEPTFLLQSGRVLLAAHNPRQAANKFARCAELAPGWPAPRLWQAQSLNIARQFSRALELTEQLNANRQGLKGPGLAQLLICRTVALRGLDRTNDAAVYLEQFVNEHGEQVPVLNAAASLYSLSSQFEKELNLREILAQRSPGNVECLAQKGLVEIKLARFETAAATLTKALSLSPNDENVRLLRAVAYLRGGQLEAAKTDYRELLKTADASQSALFGLGGIAWREHDTNTMTRYYEQFLSNSAAITPQFNIATERLRQIRDE